MSRSALSRVARAVSLVWLLAMAVGASMLGTSLGKTILERLSDGQFRTWAGRLITVLGLYYVGYGLVLLAGIA